jgi:hypothetical protein
MRQDRVDVGGPVNIDTEQDVLEILDGIDAVQSHVAINE